MASKIDMSLDDFISTNKSAFSTRRGRGRGATQSRGGRGRTSTRGNTARGRTAGRRGGPANTGSRNPQPRRQATQQFQPRNNDSVKLNISNLEFGVSDSDITELFSEFGTMKLAVLHYDREGRSLGTAHVIFERRADAMKAIEQYNDVHLDGRPMKITIDEPKRALTQQSPRLSGGRSLKRLRGGVRPVVSTNNNANRRGAKRGGPGGRGATRGNKRGRGVRKEVTADQLDAELEAYAGEANK